MIQKYVTKFKKILSAVSGHSNFNDIADDIRGLVSLDFGKMTYESTSETLKKMEKLDKTLPAIDDIVPIAKFEES